MSGAEYKMIFVNSTDEPWYFGVYQKYPESPGLNSVAWQVRRVPPIAGSLPSAAEVNWTLNYGVCMADFDKDIKGYTGGKLQESSSLRQTSGRYTREVISLDGIPNIDTKPIGVGTADQNQTEPPAQPVTMGFTASNSMIGVQDDVAGNEETIFRVHPTYYVACYRNIVVGQLVDSGVAIGPVKVKYEAGARIAKILVSENAGGNFRLSVE